MDRGDRKWSDDSGALRNSLKALGESLRYGQFAPKEELLSEKEIQMTRKATLTLRCSKKGTGGGNCLRMCVGGKHMLNSHYKSNTENIWHHQPTGWTSQKQCESISYVVNLGIGLFIKWLVLNLANGISPYLTTEDMAFTRHTSNNTHEYHLFTSTAKSEQTKLRQRCPVTTVGSSLA